MYDIFRPCKTTMFVFHIQCIAFFLYEKVLCRYLLPNQFMLYIYIMKYFLKSQLFHVMINFIYKLCRNLHRFFKKLIFFTKLNCRNFIEKEKIIFYNGIWITHNYRTVKDFLWITLEFIERYCFKFFYCITQANINAILNCFGYISDTIN